MGFDLARNFFGVHGSSLASLAPFQELKLKLQRLETQKRAALDSEDYTKAAEIKKSLEAMCLGWDGIWVNYYNGYPLAMTNVAIGKWP